jgi:hypothetical protein
LPFPTARLERYSHRAGAEFSSRGRHQFSNCKGFYYMNIRNNTRQYAIITGSGAACGFKFCPSSP